MAGCTSSDGSIPLAGQTHQVSAANARVRDGVVVQVRQIVMVQDRAPLAMRPETQGRTLSQVGGAVLGAITNESVDDDPASDVLSQEITVRMDNGDVRIVTQPTLENLQLNQRVKVIHTTERTQVTAL